VKVAPPSLLEPVGSSPEPRLKHLICNAPGASLTLLPLSYSSDRRDEAAHWGVTPPENDYGVVYLAHVPPLAPGAGLSAPPSISRAVRPSLMIARPSPQTRPHPNNAVSVISRIRHPASSIRKSEERVVAMQRPKTSFIVHRRLLPKPAIFNVTILLLAIATLTRASRNDTSICPYPHLNDA
jgi:hypothetical protein